MPRVLMIALLLYVAGFLTGCSDSDGDPGVDPFFKVTIQVEDPAGNPVPGLNLELTSDNPYLQDFRHNKARASVQFTVPRSAQVQVTVEDINGTTIRDLIDGILAAGRHEVHWDARNYKGVHQPSGRYTFRMIGYSPSTGLPEFEDTIDVLMCLVDPYYHPIGVTDEKGQVVLTDKRHFPHLYNRDPMAAVDETGQIQGLLEPTADMIITLGDTAGGGTMLIRDEIPGKGFYRFVWAPNKIRPLTHEKKAEGPEQPATIPPAEWMLGPALPNPFN
jgi:hypothetical protein